MILKAKRYYAVIIGVFLLLSGMLISADKNNQIENKTELPIIMYHHISKDKSALGDYVISPEQFENDIKYIKELGYTSITPEELAEFADGKSELPKKPIMITFDDGYLSFYEYAYPILKKYNMKAVLSVIGKQADIYSQCDDCNVNYAHAKWNQIKEMSDSGLVEISNHSYDLHIMGNRKGSMIKSGEDESSYKTMLVNDLNLLQKKINEAIGKEPICFAYPYGKTCKQSYDIIKKTGFKVSLGCEEKINYINNENPDLYKLGRFNRASGKSSKDFFKKILSK